MNLIETYTLKALSKAYSLAFGSPILNKMDCIKDSNKASELIYNKLMQDEPCMISRFGAVEISSLINYLGIKGCFGRSYIKFIKNEIPEWWWNNGIKNAMLNNAGFFPISEENLIRFNQLILNIIPSIDILGSWQPYERLLVGNMPNTKFVNIYLLDPFWSKIKWTKALEGKKILVVHPFSDLIKYQYNNNRDKIFKDSNILPEFELKTIKSVQSIGGNNDFSTWFDALESMKDKITNCEFDICLIGSGAYGMPLAAHVKDLKKKAIHIGGPLQLYFGIWGRRWDNPNYAKEVLGKEGMYLSLYNESWVKPEGNLKPNNYINVENGCYW